MARAGAAVAYCSFTLITNQEHPNDLVGRVPLLVQGGFKSSTADFLRNKPQSSLARMKYWNFGGLQIGRGRRINED